MNPFLGSIWLEEDDVDLFWLWSFLPFLGLEKMLVGIGLIYYSLSKLVHVELVVSDDGKVRCLSIPSNYKGWSKCIDGRKESKH